MDWDERYSIDEYLFGKEPAQALLRNEEHLVSGGTTLVIADGEGRNSVYLAKKGFKVTATDNSIVANRKAKSLAVIENVQVDYRLEDFFDINWSEKNYDNVIGICFQFVPHHLIDNVLMDLRSATKKGGTLLIHGYTPTQLKYGTGGPKDKSLMYTKNTFTNLFHESEIFKLEEYEAIINEGVGHSGLSAMIDFIAKF
jgi:cyclopropane fatty-acyl-phospholipid synthase-like methyltransferase|tara:strand:+ start:12 stop:605 length:594 start_codon:yes stop_codon:yes gene_type:complete